MIHKLKHIKDLLEATGDAKGPKADPFVISPKPHITNEMLGSASIDLRLGTWFLTMRQEKQSILRADLNKDSSDEHQLAKYHYVPFGREFVVHPQSFVLAATLEWIRLPRKMAAYVIGKSSWGRRGLIIATAAGVHPGFTGCLTLEICNVGEIPIALKPGMTICQLFIHEASPDTEDLDHTQFIGRRKPTVGKIIMDPVAKRLSAVKS